ncbi:MAG: hypothetical protein ACN4GW_03870 [Desulforhopalus sp.]
MKRRILALTSLFSIFLISNSLPVAFAQPGPLLPESLAARAEMAASKKTHTILIIESDAEKATQILNTSNDEYAKKGWNVFSIHQYIEDGDFEGFFVTYEKNLLTH